MSTNRITAVLPPRSRLLRRTPWIAATVLLAGAVGSGTAFAYWESRDSGNLAAAVADSLPQGATPSATATGATTVTVDFARATMASGREVTSYAIRRYGSTSSTTPSATFSCSWASGTVLDCAEHDVPAGTWYYTATPQIAGSLWAGSESPRSSGVVTDVTAPTVAVTSLSPPPNGNGYHASSPVMVNLSATDNTGGSGVASITYRVDSGAPVTVNASSASAAVTGDGTHAVTYFATDNAGNAGSPQAQTVRIDSGAAVLSGLTVPAWINLANKAAVLVSGSISESNDSTVTVVATDHNSATITRTVAVSAGATIWSTSLDATGLADGTITYSVTDQDIAGNITTPALTAGSTKDTAAPDAPTGGAIANGGGTGNAYINLANAASVSYAVTIPSSANNATTDTIAISLISGTTVNATMTPSNPGGTVTVSGINAAGLDDGTVNVQVTATDQAGNVSATKTATTPKDTAAPAGTLATNNNKYTYTDSVSPTADTLAGDKGAITSWGSDASLAVVAVKQGGPSAGTEYFGVQVMKATGQNAGIFTAITVAAASSGTVTYNLFLMDIAGNRTGLLHTYTQSVSH